MFKVNHKNTRTMSMTSFWCFYVSFEHVSQLALVSIVNFEQVMPAGCGYTAYFFTQNLCDIPQFRRYIFSRKK